jgi:membrane protein
MWVYYASLILFFGAELTQVYANRTARVVPKKYAIPVTECDRGEEGVPRQTPSPGTGKHPQASGSRGPHRSEPAASPGAVIRKEAWSFVGMMLAAGFVGGILLKFKSLRKGLRLYAALRKS